MIAADVLAAVEDVPRPRGPDDRLQADLHERHPHIWAAPGSRVITYCHDCKTHQACADGGCPRTVTIYQPRDQNLPH